MREKTVKVQIPEGKSCDRCTFVASLPGAPICPYFKESVYYADEDGIHFRRCLKCLWQFGMKEEDQ